MKKQATKKSNRRGNPGRPGRVVSLKEKCPACDGTGKISLEETDQKIVDFIQKNNPSSIDDVAKHLSLPRGSVKKRMERLCESSVLCDFRSGRLVHYYIFGEV